MFIGDSNLFSLPPPPRYTWGIKVRVVIFVVVVSSRYKNEINTTHMSCQEI